MYAEVRPETQKMRHCPNKESKGGMMYGWFSEQAKELYGSTIYMDATGKQFEITLVSSTEDYGSKYLWPDKVFLGEVGEFLCHSSKGSAKLETFEERFEEKFPFDLSKKIMHSLMNELEIVPLFFTEKLVNLDEIDADQPTIVTI